jgi:hypothetical protein
MSTSRSGVVPPPPELNWGILSTLVHLGNADKIPLPMILKVAKDFTPAESNDAAGEVNQGARRSSRFFTISKRGRTIADFTSIHNDGKLQSPQSAKSKQSSCSPFQHRGGSASSTDEQARLPNYLVNPHSAVLFSSSTSAAQAKTSGRRQSTVASRKRSSIFDLVTHMQLMNGAAQGSHDDLSEFRSTTFTRAGLNVRKLRDFEAMSDERERTVRKQIAAESGAVMDDSGDEVHRFSVSHVTPRLVAHHHGEQASYDTKHPKHPSCMRVLLERRQDLPTAETHRRASEDVDWTGQQTHAIPHPPAPLSPTKGRVKAKRLTSPPLKRHELALISHLPLSAPSTSLPSPQQKHAAGTCPPLAPTINAPVPTSYPMPASPRRPQAHPMLRRNVKPKILPSAGNGSSTSSPLNPFQEHCASFDSNAIRGHLDERGNSSYTTTAKVRELGAEVALSGKGRQGRHVTSEGALMDRGDSEHYSTSQRTWSK